MATTSAHRTRARSPREGRSGRGGCASCGAPASANCDCNHTPVPCDCGGIKCLCRPTWFAGMVLRDEDLRRLDHYIKERFRRINLAFGGPGVVAGLEVRCDPCGEGVVVGCGHAISPCGDDIVICDDAYVDVCKLIDACRRKEQADCLPHQRPRACPDIEEQWVLAVEYCERPAGGTLPLRSEKTGCDCGGSCDCKTGGTCCGGQDSGCGCATGSSAQSRRSRAAPPSCEPTLLCEDVTFRVCPPPDLTPACRTRRQDAGGPDNARGEDWGEMIDRILCCAEALIDGLPPVPTSQPDSTVFAPDLSDQWYRYICLVKQHILDFLRRYPASNCDSLAELQTLVCLRRSDFDTDAAYQAWLQETLRFLLVILVELLWSCICSGLLPPCPTPAHSTTVPLATVTVRHGPGGCRVLSVCNWTRLRRYSANLRTLEYWLSFVPTGRDLRRLLECLCCDFLRGFDRRDDGISLNQADPASNDTGNDTNNDTGAPNAGGQDDSDLLVRSAQLRERLNRRLRPEAVGEGFDRLAALLRTASRTAAPVEPLDALRDLLGVELDSGAVPGDVFGSQGRAAPAQALMFNSLAAPILRGIASSPGLRNFALDLGAGQGSVAPPGGARPDNGDVDAMVAMRTEIAELRRRLDALDQS